MNLPEVDVDVGNESTKGDNYSNPHVNEDLVVASSSNLTHANKDENSIGDTSVQMLLDSEQI